MKPSGIRHSLCVRKVALLGCSALAGLAISTQAMAQDTAEETYGVSDIIVTAQKREQSMQDVPVAITALSAETLQANRIESVQDLSSAAPNLTVRAVAGSIGAPTYTLRGSLTYGTNSGQDRTIGIYQDGVYIGFGRGAATDFPALERLEVLRGPQGTLFGRNSTAGAISIITQDPKGEFGVRQQFTYGNYNQMRSATLLNTPSWGPFSALLSYTHSERNGDVKNLGPFVTFDRSNAAPGSLARKVSNKTAKTMGARNSETIFAAVKFEPSDRFKMVYKFDYSQDDFTPEANYLGYYDPAAFGSFGNVLQSLYSSYPIASSGSKSRAKAQYSGWTTPGYSKGVGHNLTMTWKATDDVTVKNILAHRKSDFFSQNDLGGATGLFSTAETTIMCSPFPEAFCANFRGAVMPFYGLVNEAHAKQWSDEIQVNYESEAVTLTVGGIYFDVKTVQGPSEGLKTGYFTTPVAVNTTGSHAGEYTLATGNALEFASTKSLAGYAQAEVHVTPQLDVVGGARITNDRKSQTTNLILANLPYLTTTGAQSSDPADSSRPNPLFRGPIGSLLVSTTPYKATEFTYLLGVNYKPTDDILVFAKYSTGYLSGGGNATYTYKPETVKALEAGIKADLFDRRLRANLALFHNKFKNVQFGSGGRFLPVPDNDVAVMVLSEGDMRINGFELELTAAPTRGLTLNGSVGYIDVKPTNINTLVRNTSEVMVRASWTANGSVQYDTDPLFGDAFMSFRLDANYRTKTRQLQSRVARDVNGKPIFDSKVAWPNEYLPYVFSPSMLLVNGRMALKDISIGGARAELALWGKNIFNVVRPGQTIDFQIAATSTYTLARTYGVDLTFEF